MKCIICGHELTPSRVAAGCTDLDASCESLLRSDRLMRDAYAARGGTFAGLDTPKLGVKHGTEHGYKDGGCRCASCTAAYERTVVMNRERQRRMAERRGGWRKAS